MKSAGTCTHSGVRKLQRRGSQNELQTTVDCSTLAARYIAMNVFWPEVVAQGKTPGETVHLRTVALMDLVTHLDYQSAVNHSRRPGLESRLREELKMSRQFDAAVDWRLKSSGSCAYSPRTGRRLSPRTCRAWFVHGP